MLNEPESADAAARLAVAIGRLNRRIRPSADGLSLGLLSALSTIVRQGPLRPSELARIESVAPPSATRAVADLENRGFVERRPDPADGRAFFVTATADGEAAVLHARAERSLRVSALLDTLDTADRQAILAALNALEVVAGVTRDDLEDVVED
jgi:DNA-binding MarR family transcriptional regulator